MGCGAGFQVTAGQQWRRDPGPRCLREERGQASTTKGKNTLRIFSFWIKEGISVKRKFGHSFGGLG